MASEVAAAGAREFWTRLVRGPRLAGRVGLYEELASLLQAGFGIRTALANLAAQDRPGFSELLRVLTRQVEDGEPLHQALAARPDLFSPVEAALVRTGEASGRLVEALRALAARLERSRLARARLLRAVAYPGIVLHVALLLPTIPTVAVPHGFLAYLLVVAVGLVVLWGVPALLVSRHAARRGDWRYSRRVCGVPVLGEALHAAALSRFAWAFGALYDGGVSPREALAQAGRAAHLGWLEHELSPSVERVAAGDSIGDAVADVAALPKDLRDMLRTGADSGTLSEAMERGAQLYEERAERAAVRAAAAAGGVMFVLAVIVVVAFAVHVVWGYYGQVWELSGY